MEEGCEGKGESIITGVVDIKTAAGDRVPVLLEHVHVLRALLRLKVLHVSVYVSFCVSLYVSLCVSLDVCLAPQGRGLASCDCGPRVTCDCGPRVTVFFQEALLGRRRRERARARKREGERARARERGGGGAGERAV